MSGQDDSGGDFWSRRKAAVRKAEEAERAETEATLQAETRAELEQKSDQEILEELGLPDPDTLTEDDDFSGFLKASVPERLRRRALRRLWGTNPVLANLDGLIEYGEDYTDAATVIDNLQTVYQIGKGMLDKFADVEDVPAGNATFPQAEKADVAEVVSEDEASESDTAPHNDLIENKTTSMQLTQEDEFVQAGEKHDNPSDQETTSDQQDLRYQHVRRRLRFVYS